MELRYYGSVAEVQIPEYRVLGLFGIIQARYCVAVHFGV
jgi:hypothetical protein